MDMTAVHVLSLVDSMKQDVSDIFPSSTVSASDALAQLRQKLEAAVKASDLTAARKLLETIPNQGDAQLDQIAARLYMAWQQWAQAAMVLARMTPAPAQQLSHQTQLNLARNLACAQQHQPALYDVLAGDAPASDAPQYNLHRLPAGQLTITRQSPGQNPVLLSTGPDPVKAAAEAYESLKPILSQQQPLGFDGVGDGYLIAKLAREDAPTALGQRSVVHIFEPDVQALLHTMMIHDYAGADGALQQPRFVWHVGMRWAQSYEKLVLEEDLMTPPPRSVAKLSGGNAALAPLLADVQAKQDHRSAELSRQLDAIYNQPGMLRDFAQLCDVSRDASRGSTSRPPRVMLVTSRFTTVLQHETARIARAFESLGWQTRTLIEMQDHHRMLRVAMQQALADFQPDLLFTLDHLRHEQGDIMPAGLPYCCQVQDLLPNIISADAGRACERDPRQWVVTFCKPLLTQRYAYPPGRCIDAPIMMASEPALPESWEHDGPDFAYVSNLSQTPDAMIAATLSRVPQSDHAIVTLCARAIVDHYQQGRSLPGKADIAQFITPVIALKVGQGFNAAEHAAAIAHMADLLWNPLNVGLYRQQALGWIADIADEQGLSLALFGRGWEYHPRFKRYARGVIQPGETLNELVRSVKLNLNLEPYPCTTHVRLLDGLTAGGFYLIRQYAADAALPALAQLLDEHDTNQTIQTDADARRLLPASCQQALEKLLASAAGISYDAQPDVIAQLRSYQQAGVIAKTDSRGWQLLPELAGVSFHDRATAKAAIERYITDEHARRRIASQQRRAVLDRLTLTQGLSRILAQIRRDAHAMVKQVHATKDQPTRELKRKSA